jgi:hypothetical protein
MSDVMDAPKLELVVEKLINGQLVAYACRGVGRGCKRNKLRERKVHCDDCVLCDDQESLGELVERLRRGDA